MNDLRITFSTQPKIFLRLVELTYRKRITETVPPGDFVEGLAEVNDLLFSSSVAAYAAESRDRRVVDLLNLAEIAAALLETAHATLLPQLSDAEIEAALHEAYEEAREAETAEALKTPPAPAKAALATSCVPEPDGGFAGLRGGLIAIAGGSEE